MEAKKKKTLIWITTATLAVVAALTVTLILVLNPGNRERIETKIVLYDESQNYVYEGYDVATGYNGTITYNYDGKGHAPIAKLFEKKSGKEIKTERVNVSVVKHEEDATIYYNVLPDEKGKYFVTYEFLGNSKLIGSVQEIIIYIA